MLPVSSGSGHRRAGRTRRCQGDDVDSTAPDVRHRPRAAWPAALAVAAPATAVAALGLLHPVFLRPDTAEQWRLAHLLLLPLFPLVGLALWWVLRGETGPVAWAARLLAAAYALLYTSLDAIAGVGAPQQVLGTVRRGEPLPPVGDLYDIGDRLGHAGVYALAAAAVLTAVLVAARGSRATAALGAVLLLAGAYLHLRHHVFPPRGVVGVLLVGGGTGLLELARRSAGTASVPPSRP